MQGRHKIVEKWKMNKQEGLALLILAAFYLIFCFTFGVQICADSNSYIKMTTAREPVYPLLLAIFRFLFGEVNYLFFVVVFQNLLMAYAVWKIVIFCTRKFQLKWFLTYGMILFHFAVAFLCQFAAGRASIYPNSILTEGITLSLWLLFICKLLEALYSGKIKPVVGAMILAAIMMDTRKQMAITYIVIFATLLLGWIGSKGYLKKMGITLGMILLSILLAIGGTRLYNYSLHGAFAQNTRDMNLVLTTTLYVADREDAALIEEESVRNLFITVFDILDEEECNYRYAGEGWRNLEAHYGAHYDTITVDTTGPMFIEYAIAEGFAEGLPAEQEADRMSAVIVQSLLIDNLSTYASVYLSSALNGMINSIAKRGGLLDYYALFAYMIYLILMLKCLLNRESRTIGLMALTVFIGIAVNVGVAAALIFCQTRYMIYNMALFYMALLLMLWITGSSFFEKRKK